MGNSASSPLPEFFRRQAPQTITNSASSQQYHHIIAIHGDATSQLYARHNRMQPSPPGGYPYPPVNHYPAPPSYPRQLPSYDPRIVYSRQPLQEYALDNRMQPSPPPGYAPVNQYPATQSYWGPFPSHDPSISYIHQPIEEVAEADLAHTGLESTNQDFTDNNNESAGLINSSGSLTTQNAHNKVPSVGKSRFAFKDEAGPSSPKSNYDAPTCFICTIKPIDMVFDACGHVTCCECGQKIQESCPYCRQVIKKKIKLYLS